MNHSLFFQRVLPVEGEETIFDFDEDTAACRRMQANISGPYQLLSIVEPLVELYALRMDSELELVTPL